MTASSTGRKSGAQMSDTVKRLVEKNPAAAPTVA